MYHQNPSTIIRLLGALALLFVLSQIWSKPTDFDPNQLEPIESPKPQPVIPGHDSPLEVAPLLDVLGARLIDPGHSPSAELGQIRDDLDSGNYREAETKLRQLPKRLLTDTRSKLVAAALWNNLGVQQEQVSGIEVSVNAFKQAVALAPQNPIALLNLTQAYWELQDEALTVEFLESVLRVAPHDTFSHIALADVQIEKGQMVEAERHLKLVQSRALADPNLKTYFQRLAGKLDHQVVASQIQSASDSQPLITPQPPAFVAEQIPSQLSPPTTQETPPPQVASAVLSAPISKTTTVPTVPPVLDKFTIRFDGKPDPETAMRIRSILEYAHEDMSKKFGYSAVSPIQVVLHTEQKFAPDASSPAGADALYDPSSSTIHLPLNGAMDDLAILSRVLRHQFAHALLHDKMRTHMDQLPTWLAEGLAIQLAEDPWPALEETKKKPFSVISLPVLEKQWDRSQKDRLNLAYLESASAVQNIVDRQGIYGIRQIMSLLQAGQSFDAAIKQKWSVSYDQFQRDWEKTFTASMGRG